MGFTKKVAKEKKSIGADIEDTIKSIQTKFGEGAIMKLGDSPKVDIDVIPTGSLGLDMALGVGGVPRGRIIEIFGPESSGKTTLALHIVAEAQKKVVFAPILMPNMLWIQYMQKILELK